ncbi:hypothetical protein ABIA39_003426 [Nocardia sp. GAS34]|uniref:hypothetical protein n=1 Tax=unclassified Nocardia TaxID=2637762 RepID=UPI003D22A862
MSSIEVPEPVVDLSESVEVPPLEWHAETDPAELTRLEALQWISAEWGGFSVHVKQSALDEDRGEITLFISHDHYDDPAWRDAVPYESVEIAKESGVATIVATLEGELTRVAVRARIPHDSNRFRWTIVTCPIDVLGNYDAEATAIYPRLPEYSDGSGSVGFRSPVIVVDGCPGFEAGCSTWSHCDDGELDQARHEHWDCEHDLTCANYPKDDHQ